MTTDLDSVARGSQVVLCLVALFAERLTADPPLAIATDALPPSAEGVPYEATIQGTGGTEVGYVWRLTEGELPDGLDLYWESDCLSWGQFEESGRLDGSLAGHRLGAVSGLASSRENPGILWVHDDADSGRPEVYALNEDGSHRQTYRLNIVPYDWEDIAIGPGPLAGKDYVYIGDFGDNNLTRSRAQLLRFEEPLVGGATEDPIPLDFEIFYFRYPDGARDVESLFFDWETGTPYVIDRNRFRSRVYKFPGPLGPPNHPSEPIGLLLLALNLPAMVTGGDAVRSGFRMVVRNYTTAYEYARPPGGTFDEIFFTLPCILGSPGEQQYEGICYSADGTGMYTTTELAGGPVAPILHAQVRPRPTPAVIRGEPGASGDFPLTLEVRDSSGAAAVRAFTLHVEPAPRGSQLPGDCDQSGSLSVSDALCLARVLFVPNQSSPPCEDSVTGWRSTVKLLDFNGDSVLDVSDAVALLLYLFHARRGHALGEDCVPVIGCPDRCASPPRKTLR